MASFESSRRSHARRVRAVFEDVKTILCGVAFAGVVVVAAAGIASPGSLPPGQHTARPKYWSGIDKTVTNYTPLSFDYRIQNLTPTKDGGLWFSLGSSLQRIDSDGRMSQFIMPYPLWRISAIVQVGSTVWFSAGQSGKVGAIDEQRRIRFTQVVPRHFFPDIRDLVVNRAGEMWFLDEGRLSIGYRSASGRVVEHPVPNANYIVRMQHCMGRLWIAVRTSSSSRLAVMDDTLHPIWSNLTLPAHAIDGMTCDAHNNLWLTLQNYRSSTTYAARLGAYNNIKVFRIDASAAVDIAPDAAGGVWTCDFFNPYSWGLTHIDQRGVRRTYPLPTGAYGPSALAVASDGTLWLGIGSGNSPLSVARLRHTH